MAATLNPITTRSTRTPIGAATARVAFFVGSALTWACSGGSASQPQAGDGGDTLDGSYAFPVNYAMIDTQLPKDQCSYETELDGGAYASFALWMSDQQIFNDAGGMLPVTPSPSHILNMQVAGPSYQGSLMPPPGTEALPLTPGVYPIGYEDADDDELCSLPTGGAATLDRYDFAGDSGGYTQATAMSGNITLTQVGHGRIAGSFNVELAAIVYGDVYIDTAHPVPFSGTFDVTGM